MVDQKIVDAWIKKANEDFLYAQASLDEGLRFYSPICFHFHQSVEKYLKSYIIANELEFQKVHDLTTLLQICAQKDPEFNILHEIITEINPFYIETRYPGFMEDLGKENAQKAGEIAGKVR